MDTGAATAAAIFVELGKVNTYTATIMIDVILATCTNGWGAKVPQWYTCAGEG